jgi:phosphatidylinositol glycan class O
MVQTPIPKPAPGSQNSIAAQYARAKAAQDAADAAKVKGIMGAVAKPKTPIQKLNEGREAKFKREWGWVVGFFVWLL